MLLPLIIAEIKLKSPAGFVSPLSREDLLEIALSLEPWAIAFHTDRRWGGGREMVRWGRKEIDRYSEERNRRTEQDDQQRFVPPKLVAKGVHPLDQDLEEAFDDGADIALVVGRTPKNIDPQRLLIEPTSLEQLAEIPPDVWAVWNQRDILGLLADLADHSRSGPPPDRRRTETFDDARCVWPKGRLCQASCLTTIYDIHPKADAVLVGTNLVSFARSLVQNKVAALS